MKVKILKGDRIPANEIKTGDVKEYSPRVAEGLIRLGIAEEVKEEPKKQAKKKQAKKD